VGRIKFEMLENYEMLENLRSGCKINLYLRVGGLRDSGLHELRSLILPLAEPHDKIEIRPAQGRPDGSVATLFMRDSAPEPIPDIDPENNTLTRAYAWFAEQTSFAPALDITVYKGVPHGAGLGGGSADAAALLLFLRGRAARAGCLAGVPLRDEDFVRAAAQVGSDVPFFLRNIPALISGIGDSVKAAPCPFPAFILLLLCPRVRVSTAWAFSELDRRRSAASLPDPTRPTDTAADAANPEADAAPYINDFEDIVFARYPQLAEYRAVLESFGAMQARMSGTGSAIFGIFRTKKSAAAAAEALAGRGCSVYMQQLPQHFQGKHGAGV
jgi:4-diphosphocytidyl-2-C-methyl-D-erythritol kinase